MAITHPSEKKVLPCILVTGGAGFIGSHIVSLLLDADWKVVVYDNFSKGHKKNLRSHSRLVIVEGDITDANLLKTTCEQERPIAVIHAAAQVSVPVSVSTPLFDAVTNITGMVTLLECCKQVGIQRIVYLSSGGGVYGIPSQLPCTEQTLVLPVNNYGVSKYTAEQYLKTYHTLYGINYCILRLTNTYGPRQDPHGESGVISIFTDRLLRDQPLIIYGDGTQTRDFVYVEDVAKAVLLALRRTSQHLPSPFGERVFNLSFGEAISINTLAKLLQDIADMVQKEARTDANKNNILPPVQLTYTSARLGEVHDMVLDSSLAKKALGWIPSISIEQGIKKTMDWAIHEKSP